MEWERKRRDKVQEVMTKHKDGEKQKARGERDSKGKLQSMKKKYRRGKTKKIDNFQRSKTFNFQTLNWHR